MKPRGVALVLLSFLTALTALTVSSVARAEEPAAADDLAAHPAPEKPFATKPGYYQFFGTVMGGTGLRFNNPYRLATPLGSDAESVSRTAAYLDLGLAVTFGNPLGFQHGVALRVAAALEGVAQTVFTPSYFLWRRQGRFAGYGRAGVPMVLAPDVTWGLEAALGGALFFTGGLGAVCEIVGDVFYGEGTRERSVATYPVVSGQIGLIATYEVLP